MFIAFVFAQKPNEGRVTHVKTAENNSGGNELLDTITPPVLMQ